MNVSVSPYAEQCARWPKSGRHILAQYDDEGIVVYQAYGSAIGSFAVEHQYFGGPFSFNRMSWIKTNFLWMMYRSGWGTKPGQDMVLAIRMRRGGFDSILDSGGVRLQWDPDHDPYGKPLERRAIQLGLRGAILEAYATEWIVEITDLSLFVAEQREVLKKTPERLLTPTESVYTAFTAKAGFTPFAANAC